MSSGISSPGMLLRMLEGRAGIEGSYLLLRLPLLRLQSKRGHGEPVLVLPGFMADDTSTLVLRHFLKSIGYVTEGWGLGLNRGRMMDLLPELHKITGKIQQKHDQKVKLVGWSRGGMLARELARDDPGMVDRVITIGSPVKGGTDASSIGRWVRHETGMTPVAMAQFLKLRQEKQIEVPIKSIYSKLDGIVAWKACIDDVSADVEHFEIQGSHIGMGTNVEVYKLLPELLRD